MFKAKNFDQFLKFATYIFSLMTLGSIGVALYDKYMGHTDSINLSATFGFMFFTFLAKYNYAIQYWGNQLDKINNQERERQLKLEAEKNTDS